MDSYERIIYRALDVPDVLDPTNQKAAAANKVLTTVAADTERAEASPAFWANDLLTRRQEYLAIAENVVEELATTFRNHHLDPIIGDYANDRDRSTIIGAIHNRLADKEAASAERISPFEARTEMVTFILETLVAWVRDNPDALALQTTPRQPSSPS